MRFWEVVDVNDPNMISGTGDKRSFSIIDCLSDEPLRITLVWTDPPTPSETKADIVNDLNLKVTAPDGTTVYKGNVFSNGESTTGGSYDTVNNVENVYLQNPDSGRYIIEIIASEIDPDHSPQTYALVISYGQASLTINLYEGDNLISLPLDPDRPYIKEVLRSIDGLYDRVWYYDGSDPARSLETLRSRQTRRNE